MLIVSTNLDVNRVMTPAFLRRIGYRVHMDNPTPEQYTEIFERFAAALDLQVPTGLITQLIERYRAEQRPLHSCEPRDLIYRARDICRYRGREHQLDGETLDLAWRGYFGMSQSDDD